MCSDYCYIFKNYLMFIIIFFLDQLKKIKSGVFNYIFSVTLGTRTLPERRPGG